MHQVYTSVDNNSSYDVFLDPDVVMVNQVFVTFCLLYTPFIIFSNILVLCMLLLYPGFHEAFDNFLLNLAVSHLLVAAFYVPLHVLHDLNYTRTALLGHKYTCLLWLSSVTLAGVGTIHCLFLLSADRFAAVAFTGAYRSIVTRNTSTLTIIIMWCVIIFLTFSPLLGCNHYRPDITHLTRRCSVSAALPRGYVLLVSYVINGAILTASCFLCICTFAIFTRHPYTLYKVKKHRHEKWEHEFQALHNLRDSIKITNVIVVFCLVLWLPSFILELFNYYNVFTPKIYEIFNLVAQAIRFGSSIFNVSVYFLYNTKYREVMGLMLTTSPCSWRSKMEILYFQHQKSIAMISLKSPFSSSLLGSISYATPSESDTTEYIFSKFEESEALRKLSLYSAVERSKNALSRGKYQKHDKELFLAVLMMNNEMNRDSNTFLTLRELVAKRGTCVDHLTRRTVRETSPPMAENQTALRKVKSVELDKKISLALNDSGEVASLKGGGLESDTNLSVRKTLSSSVDRKISYTRRSTIFNRRMSAFPEITPRRVSNEDVEDVESTVDPMQFDEEYDFIFNDRTSIFQSDSVEHMPEDFDRFTDVGSQPFV